MKISVIMCVKNGEKYIRNTIESILNQTYQNFEFIIIDNCSTDKTLEIIKQYRDKRIKLFITNIGQLTFNLNYGLYKSIGEYIARIDADDIAYPERLEKQIGYIENYGFDIIGSNIDYIDENGDFIKTLIYPERNEEIRSKIFYKSVIAHPSVMIKKSLLLESGGYLGGRFAQDYDLWLKLMRNENTKFYNIQESLTKYRIHRDQMKGNKSAYPEVVGYLLQEAFYTKKPQYFIGALLYFFKGLVK